MKKKIKKIIKNTKKIVKRLKVGIFTFGDVDPDQGKRLLLMIAIIFMLTVMVYSNFAQNSREFVQSQNSFPAIKKASTFQSQAKKMVEGHPIEKMTPYIFEKDPRVAAFMIAIAKKESAWGERKPVLAGRDCYNYWGFRLKTESMGSGGHTCFDSPEQAVDIVASRIDELVNQEKIDSPSEMIVWKCGYGCQDKSKTADERKWISDVDIYYSKLEGYL